MNYIGLDIGTTGAKALLVDEKGTVIGKGYAGYRLISDGSRIEQRADDWTQCGASAIRQILERHDASTVAAVALSTQGASMVALDAENNPIGNALTWMDARAKAEAAELSERLGDAYIYRNTGWRVSPSLDAAKIMHMKRSGEYSRAKLFITTLEYVNLFLTGNPVCDPTNASIRQVYNVSGGDYDDHILEAVGVTRSELPCVMPTGALVGHITQAAAATTGLLQGTPVYNGAHDQYCASIGAAAIQKGDLLLSAGTTWVIMGIDDKPLFTDTYIAPAAHPVKGLFGGIASLVGSGASLQWFKNNFMSEEFEEINRTVALRADKTRELFFYPYLSGAYFPLWEIDARGAFTGVALEHDKFDFARAIMEATSFGVRRALEDFSQNGYAPKTLHIMGGAAKSDTWCSLIASACNLPLEVSSESEACALGAAIIAAKADGVYENLQQAAKAMACKTRLELPNQAAVDALNRQYANYNNMWDGISQYYQQKH